MVYNKLKDSCASKQMKNKLRWAVIIGTLFVVVTSTYGVSIVMDECRCDFLPQKQSANIIVSMMMLCGAILTWLYNDLRKLVKKCDPNIGVIPDVIFVTSIILVVFPGILLVTEFVRYNTSEQKKKAEIQSKIKTGLSRRERFEKRGEDRRKQLEARRTASNERRIRERKELMKNRKIIEDQKTQLKANVQEWNKQATLLQKKPEGKYDETDDDFNLLVSNTQKKEPTYTPNLTERWASYNARKSSSESSDFI